MTEDTAPSTPGQPQPAPQAGVEQKRTSGKAIASLVLGIVGLLILPIVCSTLAIVFGTMARNETQRDPGLGGRGMATAGFVLGIVSLVVWIIVLIAVLGSG